MEYNIEIREDMVMDLDTVPWDNNRFYFKLDSLFLTIQEFNEI
jgi:hypothetical protein